MSDPTDPIPPRPRGGLRLGTVLSASKQNFTLLYQTVVVVVVAAVAVAVLGLVLSVMKLWILVLATVGLGAVVAQRSHAQRQRAWWVDQGCCAACGTDLGGQPVACPQCGRDAALDEPTWRRLRREHEAKYGRPDPAAGAAGADLDDAAVPEAAGQGEAGGVRVIPCVDPV